MLITKKWLIVILGVAIVLALAMAAGVWIGSLKIDSSGSDPTIAVIGTVGVFCGVFLTSRRDFSETSKIHPKLKNQLPLWICGTLFVAGVDFSFWLRSAPLRLRDFMMLWTVLAAVVARIIQYRTVRPEPSNSPSV
jgi:uncharacterized protein YneF (UPF0154 family)